MSDQKTFESIEEYAEHVRKTTVVILSRLTFKHYDDAAALVAGLCNESAGIVQGAKMKEEVEVGFDLSTLPKPKDVAPDEDTESPFYQE